MTTALENRLKKREKAGNLRKLTIKTPLVDFSSNDYLGLARSHTLAQMTMDEWNRRSTGSTGSRLLTGNSAYAEQLEEKIASFHGYESGTLFNCGYMANLGLISAVANGDSTIIYDAAIHASTRDGIRLSRAKAFPFRHNDLNHLEDRLKRSNQESYICIESIYSTDGSQAPMDQIYELVNRYHARLIVDEAHAVGVFGPMGKGLTSHSERTFAKIVTFGKALGAHGAIVLGRQALKNALINFATPFIYTTALPLQMLAAISCSYDLFPNMNKERDHLQKLIGLVRRSSTQIQPISIPGNEIVKRAANFLAHQGLDVRPLISPTVQRGHEMLRICLHAFNTEQEINQLLLGLKNNGIVT